MLKVYGMIAFQFDIHPMLMTIEVDMQNKAKVGSAVCYGLMGKINAMPLLRHISISKMFELFFLLQLLALFR